MSEWVSEALSAAAQLSTAADDTQLYNDICRVQNILEEREEFYLRDPRVEEICIAIEEAQLICELSCAIKKISNIFDVKFCTFCVLEEVSGCAYSPKIITNYPATWVEKYISSGYDSNDPIMVHAALSEDDFYWSDVICGSPFMQAVMDDAHRNGLGRSGFTSLCVHDDGDKFALVACSDLAPEEFKKEFAFKQADFGEVCAVFADAIHRIVGRDRNVMNNLSPDAMRLMRAIATGATQDELEKMSFIYGSYWTVEKETCRRFQTRTLMEATVMAARMGLLNTSPLTDDDVQVVAPSPLGVGLELEYDRDLAGAKGRFQILDYVQAANVAEPMPPIWIPKKRELD